MGRNNETNKKKHDAGAIKKGKGCYKIFEHTISTYVTIIESVCKTEKMLAAVSLYM